MTRTPSPQPERTAAEAYAARRQAVESKLKRLQDVIDVYDEWQRGDDQNWSHVGNITRIDKGLERLLDECEDAAHSDETDGDS